MNITNSKLLLRRAIQVALAGSMLASGVASAVLQDHGPSDRVILFPDWYRDTEGLALGLCRSTSAYCFPLAANPDGFAGNIGDEAFYNLVEFKSTTTGSDFQYRYLGALEASYLPGPTPTHGQETVFARIRITFNFNDPNKNGTYVVTHPFGVNTFDNVQATAKTNLIGSQAANFFTVDVPLGNDFEGPLLGPVGPFIKWDTNLPLVSGAEEFVGDPTVLHSFTGSPFGTNFLEIQGPAGSNLDGLEPNPVVGVRTPHDTIRVDLATVLGQKWTAPIAQPLEVDSAVKTRSATTNGIDVWATSSPNQEIIVTGTGMPSLELYPSTVPGKYHGHIEYPSAQEVPAQVTVTNLSSIPVVSASAGLVDVVEISQATFDTTSRMVTVVAHTSENKIHPDLTVEGIPGVVGSTLMTTASCALTVATNDVCYTTTLASTIEPPASISVLSTDLGTHADHVLQRTGGPQNAASPTASDITCKVGITGATILATTAPVSCSVALPADAMITTQPLHGTVTHPVGSTTWTWTPGLGAFAAPDFLSETFKYVKQVTPTVGTPFPSVSNEASGTLKFVPAPPAFAATTNLSSIGFTLNWNAPIGASGYQVTVGAGTPTIQTATSLAITAAAGTNTTVTVAACNNIGAGLIPNCSTATSISQFTLPAIPVISGITSITATGMTVNWGAVTGATGYSLQYSTNGGTTWTNVGAATATTGVRLSAAVNGASTSASVIGLTSNTSYVFHLLATDPAGNSAAYSATSTSATTLIPPPAVPALTATNISAVITSGFTATWSSVTGATSYNVTVNGVTSSVTAPTKVVTGLNAGVSNTITVSACNQAGASCSAPTTALTQWTQANAPTGVVASNLTDTSLTITWAGTAQSFKVERSTSSTFATIAGTTPATTNSASITGLSPNTTYYFRVKGGVSVAGVTVDGAASSAISALTQLAIPTGLKGVNGVTNDTAITAGLSWTNPAGATAYEVRYYSNALTALLDIGSTKTAAANGVAFVVPTGTTLMKVRAIKSTAPTNTSAWSATVSVVAR